MRSSIHRLSGMFVAGLLGCASAALPTEASALEWLDGKAQLHGFAGQGATYTDHYNVFGTSRDVSLDFREIGLTSSLKPFPNLLVSAQGLYRDAGGSDEQGVRLDFAQADYSAPLFDSSLVLGVRGGRVKIPFGLYNDTRDMMWTRPSVMLPQSVYFDTLALRQAMLAADGGVFYGHFTEGDHRFGWEFLAAEPQDNTGGTPEFLSGVANQPLAPKSASQVKSAIGKSPPKFAIPGVINTPGDIPSAEGRFGGRPMLMGRAFYEWMGGRAKAMFSIVDLDRDFTSTSPFYRNGNTRVTYPLFSAQYNAEKWSLTGEYGWVNTSRAGYQGFLRNLPTWQSNTSENFYVQGEYRFTPTFSAVLRYDVLHLNRDDRSGKELSRLSGGEFPASRFFARDLTVGVRWSFARNFLWAADYHYVNGTAWLNQTDNSYLYEINPSSSARNSQGPSHFNLFTSMVSVRF